MQRIRAVGRAAAAKKYDILSAMMAHALAGDAQDQRLVLRLMALITTRYNWQADELSIGQREIARLWCVDERTVKRDMARLRASGWITVKRQGARGRVSVLGLDLDRILLDTRPAWSNIGPDYVARMGAEEMAPEEADRTVVPFRRADVAAAEGSGARPAPIWRPRIARCSTPGSRALPMAASMGVPGADRPQSVPRHLLPHAPDRAAADRRPAQRSAPVPGPGRGGG
ncbi:hypothetical protein ACFSYD_17875 [Paracoccus aerius]